MVLDDLGVVYPARWEPERLASFAATVEELGFGHLWLVEDCFLGGGLTLAATALATTRRLRVGVGLLAAPLRNPALAAMEIATLARMHPGRFTATVGHGVRAWMRQTGALPADRIGALEETTAAIRGLLSGARVNCQGAHVRFTDIQLELAPQEPPDVLIGSTGPRGLEIARQVADGILLPEGCGPDFVTWARSLLAAEEPLLPRFANAPPPPRKTVCATYAWLSLAADPAEAIDRLAPALRRWIDSEDYPVPQRIAGVDERIAGVQREPGAMGDLASLAARVSICGDGAMCAQAVMRFLEAGARPLLLVPQSPEPLSMLEELVADVVPRLRR